MIDYDNLGKVNQPYFEELKSAFEETLESGWYVLGKKVKEFELSFAKRLNQEFCVGVASGLDALILSLRSLDLAKDSEVIVASNTYIATIIAIIHNRLTPVLVEPDLKTYNINPTNIASRINEKTKAILITHLYGAPCPMPEITALSKKHNLFLIEDCAQAHGAKYDHQYVGTFGDFGAFSFYPSKNLGALGDAGAVLTGKEEFAHKLQELRNYGSSKKYHFDSIGINSRLDELQAAFLLVKLKYLEKLNKHKKILAKLYLENLKKDFILPQYDPKTESVYHIFPVRHPARDKVRDYLMKEGINTEIHYPVPPHQQKSMQKYNTGNHFPIAEKIHQTIFSLPISTCHSENDIEQVIEIMNRF